MAIPIDSDNGNTYIIIPLSEAKTNIINDCIDTSLEVLRIKNDNTRCFLKYQTINKMPASLKSAQASIEAKLGKGIVELNHGRAFTKSLEEEWVIPDQQPIGMGN